MGSGSAIAAFLFTDIVGSTELWEAKPAEMAEALEEHDRILREEIDKRSGRIFSTAGDLFAAAFSSAVAATESAVATQLRVEDVSVAGQSLAVRSAVHLGEAQLRNGDYSTEQRLVERARIVLLVADGLTNVEVAAGVTRQTVGKWRERFREQGLDALGDARRSGRPLTYDYDDRLQIVKTVTTEPPDPDSYWTSQRVADAVADLGISASQVWRILSDLDLKPWQSRSWLTSHDPDFREKASDVCGLYLKPPENALVLSVDEKTEMQAKTPTNPTRKARPGLVERREFEYRRNGTAALFAALNVHSGEVIWDTKDRNRSVDFIAFLEHVDQVTPHDLTVHLVLDNGASHTSKQTRAWLEDPDRVHRFEVHHTPTHASWLNQVELSLLHPGETAATTR